jgi:hypothetical protein
MISIRLNDFWIQRLVELPESGMGYQRVDFIMKDGRTVGNVTVLNAEECQVNEEFSPDDIAEVRIHRTRG